MLRSIGGARLACINRIIARQGFEKLNKIQTVSAREANARDAFIKAGIRVAVTRIEIDYFLQGS
jgi:hypothetical protein